MNKGTTYIVRHKYNNRKNLEDVLMTMLMKKNMETHIERNEKKLAGSKSGRYNEGRRDNASMTLNVFNGSYMED